MEKRVLEKILKIILDNIEDGIHVIDSKGISLYYNKAMEEIEGFDALEVIGKNISTLFNNFNSETSTLLRSIKTKDVIEFFAQDYTNFKGKNISTINHSYPIIIDSKVIGAIEVSKDLEKIKRISDYLLKANKKLKNKKEKPSKITFDDIIGESQIMLKTKELAKKSALSDSTVFIVGETGTGKELFAKSIHNESKRKNKPFIAVNCAAIPETLMESIIFGTVKGAFTGSIDKIGLFEQANNGTLFLDEINSMSLNLQSKLLRILQEGVVRKIGGAKETKVDVRIIVATNENPIKLLNEGLLRKDLYYRINVIRLDLFPLREHLEDIELLCNHFINKYSYKLGVNIEGVTADLLESFKSHNFKGNVRELENLIESAINLKDDNSKYLDIKHLPSHYFLNMDDRFINHYNELTSLDNYLNVVEKNIINKIFLKEKKNISNTAKILKISRQNLQYKLKKHGLK